MLGFGPRTHMGNIKEFLQQKFQLASYSFNITDAELYEAFTLPSFKAAAPKFADKDLSQLQLIGDRALDAAILRILRKRNFAGSFHDKRVQLVGNEPEQPLNKLFDEWNLGHYVRALEDKLSPHQKADVLEAILGLLSDKGLLNDEMIERIFAPFLPPAVPKPAAAPKPQPTAADFAALCPEVLKLMIKSDSSQVRALSEQIIKAILEHIIITPCGEIGPLIRRLAVIANEYNTPILMNFANDDRLSLEKFMKIFAVPRQRAALSIFSSSPVNIYELGRFPLRFLKLQAHYQFDSYALEALAKAWIAGLKTAASAEESRRYAEALKSISPELKGHEFLIAGFNALTEDKQALLPSFKPFKHLASSVRHSEESEHYWLDQIEMNKLINLPIEEFKACVGLLDKSKSFAASIKAEIQRRMAPANEKTRKAYLPYLQCFEETIAARPALTLASAIGGSASAASHAPAPAQ
ncbi:MAG: hypothetical protein K0S29_1141 [Gammaproteobacteria bacterium]|jgi:hypothetical protein|nr:hypothetical protein [Gammaproteobacteria bacterium]